jgi:hypothetical protein
MDGINFNPLWRFKTGSNDLMVVDNRVVFEYLTPVARHQEELIGIDGSYGEKGRIDFVPPPY